MNARLHHPRDELVSSHHLIGGWYFKPARGSCSVIRTWGFKEYSQRVCTNCPSVITDTEITAFITPLNGRIASAILIQFNLCTIIFSRSIL